MRVIAGEFKGRKLEAPPGMATRPILDRVKESLFDWLGSRLAMPGRLPPVAVCDIFCGGGSLGIESLSRGAAYCAFVDSSRAARNCLTTNLRSIGVADNIMIYDQPAETIVAAPPGGGFDLVFLDPPYRLSEDLESNSLMSRLTARIGSEIATQPNSLIIWRHDESCVLPDELPGRWTVSERRSWGGMAITLLQKCPQRSS